jgi:hypothetical protein
LTGYRLVSFLEFWDAFGYKEGKSCAASSWLDIPEFSEELVGRIVKAAKAESERRPGIIKNGKTHKMAQGWLTDRRWEDDIQRDLSDLEPWMVMK